MAVLDYFTTICISFVFMSVVAIILKLLKSQIKIDSTALLTLEYCSQTRATIFLIEVCFYAAVMCGLNIANVVLAM